MTSKPKEILRTLKFDAIMKSLCSCALALVAGFIILTVLEGIATLPETQSIGGLQPQFLIFAALILEAQAIDF